MSSKTSTEIECLARLDELCSIYDEVMDFLIKEDLMTREEARAIRSTAEVPKMLHTRLVALSKAKKLQLLEFEWIVLPLERIKIMVVTDRVQREFSFGY